MAQRVIDPAVWDGFLEEASGYQTELEALSLLLDKDRDSRETWLQIYRLSHSMKGIAAMVGLEPLTEASHAVEELAESVAAQPDAVPEEPVGMFREGLAAMQEQLEQLRHGPPAASEPIPLPAASSESLAIDPYLFEGFQLEAEEHLQNVSRDLRILSQQPQRLDLVNNIRRAVHTLKGAAAMVGVAPISQLSHRMEDLLEEISEQGTGCTKDVLSLLHATADVLGDLSRQQMPTIPLERLYERYEVATSETAAVPSMAMSPTVEAEPEETEEVAGRAYSNYVRVPIERLDQMVRVVSELLVNHAFLERQLTQQQQELGELEMTVSRVRKLATRLDSEYAVAALQESPITPGRVVSSGPMRMARGASGPREFDSLEFDRYGDFHLVCRDLTEASTDLQSGASRLGALNRDLDNVGVRLSRFVSDMQDHLLRLRLVPFSSVSDRLHRTVRVAAEACGKEARLRIHGENASLDKAILEEIVGPLEHALRNAVDHGLEPARERVGLGKSAVGEVRLSVVDDGSEVTISVADDGRGLDYERLRRTIVERALASEEEAAGFGPAELQHFLFQPGFSTAETTSQISGRGVGLDVLKTTTESLRGALRLESTAGQGTNLQITLPLSLSILRVLIVRVGTETYAVPQRPVEQIVRPRTGDLLHGDRHYLLHDGERVPLLQLNAVLRQETLTLADAVRKPTLLINLGDRRVALVVDQVVETRDVVVKSVGRMLGSVPGVSGATILGDGSVVLILNPGELDRKAAPPRLRAVTAENKRLQVLVVDDSLSVRRILSNCLRNAGHGVAVARDGVEAMELVAHGGLQPDCFLIDVEMPRMDGFELTRQLRETKEFRYTPIIMVTSRSGDKHRRKAAELGASSYLIKPYHEETLLNTIRDLVQTYWSEVGIRAS